MLLIRLQSIDKHYWNWLLKINARFVERIFHAILISRFPGYFCICITETLLLGCCCVYCCNKHKLHTVDNNKLSVFIRED